MDEETDQFLKEQAGLVFGGRKINGEEQWIGWPKQWEEYERLRDLKEQEINDPPEGSPYHPDYGKEKDNVEDVPF